jgi:diamine N-acetyltransferase
MPDRTASQLRFRRATPADIPLLRSLAEQIWRVSYATMLSPEQIDYMLAWMYGPDRIAAELEAGVTWQIAGAEGAPSGYLAVSFEKDGTAELHKLYLLPERQGCGEGQQMLAHVEGLALRHGCARLTLRVNKTNARALRAYGRAGFRVVDSLVAEIGGGFVMDDYVLARTLQTRAGVPASQC